MHPVGDPVGAEVGRSDRPRSSRWVPLAILLAGGLATVGVWSALDTARRHQVSREVEAETAAVEHELAARIDDRIRALRAWWGVGPGRPSEGDGVARRRAARHRRPPGLSGDRMGRPVALAVAWVEPTAGNEGVVGVDLGREPVQRATMDEARARRAAAQRPRSRSRKAASGCGSSFRSSSERTSDGFVLAVFDDRRLFRGAPSAEIAPGFAVSVFADTGASSPAVGAPRRGRGPGADGRRSRSPAAPGRCRSGCRPQRGRAGFRGTPSGSRSRARG